MIVPALRNSQARGKIKMEESNLGSREGSYVLRVTKNGNHKLI